MREGRRRPSLGKRNYPEGKGRLRRNEGGAPAPLVVRKARPGFRRYG